jgi:hypothetical protein
MDSKMSLASRSLFQTTSKLSGLSLEDAAKRGDMERVSQIAVELLRVARQGDVDGVLALISAKQESQGAAKSSVDVKFSPNISVVHELHNGISVEQVCTMILKCFHHILTSNLRLNEGANRSQRKCN